ncbi:hypothetical protein [Actinomadura kijaniata]|uniref:hypothetical protein n=1 Tax=Actinomadura kijaniata TaxID=46161 RepID=UPI001FE18E67|nr:hypothetical protein [Actinomadura kijaniata]
MLFQLKLGYLSLAQPDEILLDQGVSYLDLQTLREEFWTPTSEYPPERSPHIFHNSTFDVKSERIFGPLKPKIPHSTLGELQIKHPIPKRDGLDVPINSKRILAHRTIGLPFGPVAIFNVIVVSKIALEHKSSPHAIF